MSTLSEREVGELDKPHLRPDQMQSYEDDIKGLEAAKTNRDVRHKGILMSQLRKVQNDVDTQRPDRLIQGGTSKDALKRYADDLHRRFTANMPTQEELRKNAPGAVDKLQRWEKAHKRDVLRWKNALRELEPDNTDPDYTNIERYRPAGAQDRLRTDAQIQGHMSYGNVPPENWTRALGEGPQNTAQKQNKRVMTAEQKEAARERMAKVRAARKHHTQPASEPSSA